MVWAALLLAQGIIALQSPVRPGPPGGRAAASLPRCRRRRPPPTCNLTMSTLPLPLALRVPQAGGPHVNGACFGADGEPDRQMHGCSAVWAEAERKERLAEAAAQAIAQSAVFAATLALRRLRGGTRRGTRLGTRRGAQRAASAAVA